MRLLSRRSVADSRTARSCDRKFQTTLNLHGRPRRNSTRRHLSEGSALPSSSIQRSEEHTSELQSLMRTSYAGFRLKKKTRHNAYLLPVNSVTIICTHYYYILPEYYFTKP